MAETWKHTPGPWRVDLRTDRIVADSMSVGKPVVLDVARAFPRRGKQETDANARLIAAAPEMLEALKKSAEGWANAIELGIIAKQHVATAEILRDEALAIIAKAFIAALGAQTPPEGVVTEAQGWRLVPEEPTSEMIDAGQDAERAIGPACSTRGELTAAYRAMLAAAPTPPVNQSEGADRG